MPDGPVIDLFLPLEHFPVLGLFVLLLLGGVGFPIPEDATLILCGALISHGVITALYAMPAVYAGILIADMTLYWTGRKYGRAVVATRWFRRLLPQTQLAKIENAFHRRGALSILLGRHLAGLRAQLFLVAGIVRMPFATFLMSDAVSASMTITLMVGAGYLGGNSLQVLRRDISRIEHIAVVAAITALAVFLLYRYCKARKGEKKEGKNE